MMIAIDALTGRKPELRHAVITYVKARPPFADYVVKRTAQCD